MSTQRRIYLDFNATAPLVPAARDAMVEAMGDVGNPSSIHAEGRRMRDRVERARNQVAALVGQPREQVVFTSGGTEANWLGVMALAAAAEARGLPRVVATTALEHPSLRGPIEMLRGRGWEVLTLHPLDKSGPTPIDFDSLPRAGVVAVAAVNHELGTLVDLRIVEWAQRIGALLHLDAVQAVGKTAVLGFGAQSISISGHKLGGPQGIGALVISADEGLPQVEGGHQERGRRPGTENVLGIIGFGAAAAALGASEPWPAGGVASGVSDAKPDVEGRDTESMGWARAERLGARLEREVVQAVPRARVHGAGAPGRLSSTVNFGFEGARGESIVMALDLEGISVSTGAACTSGSIQPSSVLLGLGFSEDEAGEGVRFSLGPTTTTEEISRVLEVLPGIVERARRHR